RSLFRDRRGAPGLQRVGTPSKALQRSRRAGACASTDLSDLSGPKFRREKPGSASIIDPEATFGQGLALIEDPAWLFGPSDTHPSASGWGVPQAQREHD